MSKEFPIGASVFPDKDVVIIHMSVNEAEGICNGLGRMTPPGPVTDELRATLIKELNKKVPGIKRV